MFAGSILDLEPDTAYEARFVLSDPDGVSGSAANATRDAHRPHASRTEPAEGGKGLSRLSGRLHRREDRAVVCRHHVRLQLLLRRRRHGAGRTAARQAGDIILVHAGTYAYRYELYANQTTSTRRRRSRDVLPDRGRHAEKPIVIKAAGDGEVIIDGRNNFNLFNVKAADYNYFEGSRSGTPASRSGRARSSSPARRADGQALPLRAGRHGRVHELLGLEQLLHRRQRVPGRNDSKHLIGWNGRSGSSSTASTARSIRRS
jgi:hypothetical protein